MIMGDSDDSYDFESLEGFVEQLEAGYDLVLGNRFAGGIKDGAMPPLHRYFGNPLLTAIGRLLFKSPVNDFYCGLRGFRRDAILRLGLTAPGMEFALEMIVKSTIGNLRITEVPTTLHPDGRGRPPHLRSWRDGWRSLRFYLLLSPEGLFLYPGLALAALSGITSLVLFFTNIRIGSVVFAQHTLIITCALTVIGIQSVFFWTFAKSVAIQKQLLLPDSVFKTVRPLFNLERCLCRRRPAGAERTGDRGIRAVLLVQSVIRTGRRRHFDQGRLRGERLDLDRIPAHFFGVLHASARSAEQIGSSLESPKRY